VSEMRPDDMADGEPVRPDAPHDPQTYEVVSHHALTEDEQRARKRRILATGLALAAFVVLVFIVSMARLQTNIGAGAAG